MTITDGFQPDQDPIREPQFSRIPVSAGTILPKRISAQQFQELLWAGRVVDGRCGGALIGRSFEEGGVRTIFKLGSEYLIEGLVEGGSYLVNWEAAALYRPRLNAMNAGRTLREVVPDHGEEPVGNLLMTFALPHDRFLWIDWATLAVNREPALKHIAELRDLNLGPNPYLKNCDHYQLLGCDGTADGIL